MVGYGDGMFNLEHIEGNKKKRRKKKGKNKQFGTDETLDMIWGRVIREATMPPTHKSAGVDQAEWNSFEIRWEQYKKKVLPSKYAHSAHLYSCLEEYYDICLF